MEKLGASVYLEDSDCNEENVVRLLGELITNTEKLILLQNNAKKLAKPHATENIIKEIKTALTK